MGRDIKNYIRHHHHTKRGGSDASFQQHKKRVKRNATRHGRLMAHTQGTIENAPRGRRERLFIYFFFCVCKNITKVLNSGRFIFFLMGGKLNLFSFPFNQNSCWNDEIISNRDRELCSRWFICWDDIKLKGIECLGRCVRWKTFGEKRPPLGMRNVCAVRCVTYRGQQSRCVCDYPPYTHIYKWRFNPMRSPLYFSKIEHSFSSFKMMMITQRRNEERLTVVERQLPWRFRRRDR